MKRNAQIALFVLAGLFFGRAAWNVARYRAFQAHPGWVQTTAAHLRSVVHSAKPGIQILGRLDIPRLHSSNLVLEGDDEDTLAFSVGHVEGTAALGALGNTVIAGHRDSAFGALRHIRKGDLVRVSTGRTFVYQVTAIEIVSPDDLDVLAASASPELTLITCYPFRFAGGAPQRYIVRARLVKA